MPTTIYWPSALSEAVGQLLPDGASSDGYGYQGRSPSLDVSFGMVDRARQVYSDAPADFDSISWLFTANQWAYFKAWWFYTLAGGTRPFWLPLLVEGVLEHREVSFRGRMPAASLVGRTHWRATGSVSTLKGTQMSPEDFATVEEAGGVDALLGGAEDLDRAVNVIIPELTEG